MSNETYDSLCICGHDWGSHNDITKRCCFRVMLGWDREIDLPAMRTCNLCPPSGFKRLVPNDSFENIWPEGERIHRDESLGLHASSSAELDALKAEVERLKASLRRMTDDALCVEGDREEY